MTPRCKNCGHPKHEHSFNGACYGLCGDFRPMTPTNREPASDETVQSPLDIAMDALFDVRRAIFNADQKVLTDTLWMPDDTYKGGTVVDFIENEMERVRALRSAAKPPAIGVDAVARLAYGYELMHTALCHIAGTSGADRHWYVHKAQEITERITRVGEVTADSNPGKPGDCLRGYRQFVASLSPAATSGSEAGGEAVQASELVRAASALLNNLWQVVWKYERTHEENWKEFDRKFPGVKWLRDARDAALAKPASSPAGSRVEQDLRAQIDELLTEREFLTSVISKSHEPHCALWSDEPADCDCRASSPAGARVEDVARTLYASTHPVVRAHYGDGGSFCDFSELEQVERDRLNAMAEAAIAALSPSTSAAEPVAMDNGLSGYGEFTPITVRSSTAPAAVDGQRVKVRDWLAVARAAGQHGVRYRTNRALEAFLSEIRACLATDKEGA